MDYKEMKKADLIKAIERLERHNDILRKRILHHRKERELDYLESLQARQDIRDLLEKVDNLKKNQ
jgi:hypothetical protein